MRRLARFLVVACALSGVAILPFVRTAAAQPASGEKKSDLVTDRARAIHKEGDELYAKGDIPRARVAYVAAWNLKKHWQLAASLGDCEIKLSLFRDAAEHLTFMVRSYPESGDKAKLEAAKVLLAKAKAKVFALVLKSSVEGADVSVDGVVVGQTPLADPLFFVAGTQSIELKKLGYAPKKTTFEAKTGAEEPLVVTLDAEASPPVDGTSFPPGARTSVPSRTKPGSGRAGSQIVPKRSPLPGALLTGAGAVGLGVGIGLLVVATGKRSDAEAEGKGLTCSAARRDAGCAKLEATVSSRNAFLGGGGAALGAGIGLATAGIAYLLWPDSPAVVVPTVGPTSRGLMITGSF